MRNNIALIPRGTLNFSNKVANAMAAGARAAVIYNNASGNFSGTLQVTSNWIPAISLSQADGLALQALLPATATVVNSPDPSQIYQYLDGTSMATPHVSGAVAFAAMNFPSETVTQRIQRVLANVDVISGLSGKVRTGGRLNLQRIVDTDANGLPDWWELQYFGHLTGTDPNADPDHDGMSNLQGMAGRNQPDQCQLGLAADGDPHQQSQCFCGALAECRRKILLAGTFHQPADGFQFGGANQHRRHRAHQHRNRHGRSSRQSPLLPGGRGAIAVGSASIARLKTAEDWCSPSGRPRLEFRLQAARIFATLCRVNAELRTKRAV